MYQEITDCSFLNFGSNCCHGCMELTQQTLNEIINVPGIIL